MIICKNVIFIQLYDYTYKNGRYIYIARLKPVISVIICSEKVCFIQIKKK